MRRRRSRLVVPLVLASAAGVALAGVPAAVSIAAPAAHPVATAERTAAPILPTRPIRMPSTVTGWRTSAKTVAPGHLLRDGVRTTGPRRTVRLERWADHRWRVVDRVRSDTAGRATLVWRMPTAPGRVGLRVHVLHTAHYRAVLSAHRVLHVRGGAKPAPKPTGTPTPTGTPSPTATPTASPAPSTPPASADEARRQQLLTLVNDARSTARTCGDTRYPAVPALVRSAPLDRAANDFAVRMATEDFFDHTAPDGTGPADRLKAVGISGVAWAENIAAGQSSPQTVMDSWLQSPGHCANIMSSHVTRVGFGYSPSSTADYRTYWVQDFAG